MIQILLKPTIDNLRKDFEDFSDEDEDALLFEQGIDIDALDIEDGDSFVIPQEYVGEVLLEDAKTIEVHPIINGEDMFLQMGYSIEEGDELEEGSYELKGNVIKKFLK